MVVMTMGTEVVEVDLCSTCDGMWLDSGELRRLVPRPPGARPDLAEVRKRVAKLELPRQGPATDRACPICSRAMNGRALATEGRIWVEYCPGHGVFLDPGKLRAIREYAAVGGLALSAAESNAGRLGESWKGADASAGAAPEPAGVLLDVLEVVAGLWSY